MYFIRPYLMLSQLRINDIVCITSYMRMSRYTYLCMRLMPVMRLTVCHEILWCSVVGWYSVVCGIVWCLVWCGVWYGLVCGIVWCVMLCCGLGWYTITCYGSLGIDS